MPVPTPPKKDLFKVTPPRPAGKTAGKPSFRAKTGPSKSTQKLSKEIQDLTEAQKDDANTVAVQEPAVEVKAPVKRTPFVPPEHLTQNPFRESSELRKLGYQLKKETDPKKPVKRSPKRTPSNKTTGAK